MRRRPRRLVVGAFVAHGAIIASERAAVPLAGQSLATNASQLEAAEQGIGARRGSIGPCIVVAPLGQESLRFVYAENAWLAGDEDSEAAPLEQLRAASSRDNRPFIRSCPPISSTLSAFSR